MDRQQIPAHIKDLARQWLEGSISPEGLAEFNAWYNQFSDEELQLPNDEKYAPAAIKQRMLHNLHQELEKEQAPVISIQKKTQKRYRIMGAAAILLLVCGISYFWFNRDAAKPLTEQSQPTITPNNDIMPGGNKATLTIADGSVIVLDSLKNGRVADQGNTTILKVNDGQLAYNTAYATTSEVIYNTITVPRGGQFEIVLPDGSKAFLNSVSSLRFPTAFNGKERTVELSGEAYFEIAKNADMPFNVQVAGMNVQVLGTHFNIMAYINETSMNTTLLEGAVKVSKKEESIVLQPGQQAQLDSRGNIKLVENANIEQAVAWKNGYIQLSKTDIPTVLRQIERWYDVEVEYAGAIPEGTLSGRVSRSLSLSKVMRALQLSGIEFEMNERKVIVKP